MPTQSSDVARTAPNEWATAGDRQEAARQAYRRSVADGRPLTGVELGARFNRSARWGTDRTTEVRSEDISRGHGNHAGNGAAPIGHDNNRSTGAPTGDTDAGLRIGRNGNGIAAATAAVPGGKIDNDSSTNDPPLPTGNNGNSTHPDSGSTARPSRRNGNRSADATAPRRSNGNGNGNGKTSPIGNSGNGNLASHSAGHEPPSVPPSTSTAAADDMAATPAVRRITTVGVLAVALVAGVASYDHQRVLAELAGEGWRAYLLPLSVDGLIVAASMSMLVRRRAGEPAGALAWCALLLGLAASLAANVVAADPELVDPVLVSRVVAAWPPIALGLSFELSIGQLRPANPRSPRR